MNCRMLAALVAAGLPLSGAAAQAVFSTEVGGDIGYAENPFFIPGGSGSAFVSVDVSPQVVLRGPTSDTRLRGSYTREEYFQQYGSTDSYSVDARHNRRLSERLSMSVGADYSDSRNAQGRRGFFRRGDDPIIGPVVPGADPAAGGGLLNPLDPLGDIIGDSDAIVAGARRRRLSLDGSLTWQLAARDQLAFSANYTRSIFPSSALFNDYDIVSGQVSYSHQVDDRLSVGGSLAANRLDNGPLATSTSYTPQATASYRFSEVWSGSAGLGVSFNEFQGGGNSRSLAFNFSLCGRYPATTLCFNGSRSTQANGVRGQQISTVFGATASHRIDEASTIGVSASYVRASAGNVLLLNSQTGVDVTADYSRRLTERLRLRASTGYQRRSTGTAGKVGGMVGTIGLSVTLGRTR